MKQVHWAIVLSAMLAALDGCHTMRFRTGGEPAERVVHDWHHFYFFELVPTRTIDVATKCQAGVVAIEEETTFLDGVIRTLTLGLWTPRSVQYHCRSSAAGAGDS